mmetsp:Transcript_8741/g.13001  ORF Transcript_8741/g.13001 Transcript_8741/m.13001 type:complete len:244 (+) Transcript_8741:1156-1887(+)
MKELLTAFLTALVAGSFAGCAVDLTLYPLDFFKTRIQSKSSKPFKLSQVYSGLSWTLLASMPCAGTFWGAYTLAKYTLGSQTLAALAGSLSASIVRNPFEVLKQQLQAGYQQTPLNILNTQGISGLYVGVGSLVMRELPFDTLQMVVYEFLKQSMDLGPLKGAVSGSLAAFVTTPIDVAKTRIMTDSGKGVYKNLLQTVSLVYKDEGLASLWAGCLVRVLFATFGGMIFFNTYELVFSIISYN